MVEDSGVPPQTATQSPTLVVPASAPPPPPPSDTWIPCSGSCSGTVGTNDGTETVSGTSVGNGSIVVSVATQTLAGGGLDYSPQVTDVVSSVTFPSGLAVLTSINQETQPKDYETCYSDPTAFVDAAGQQVTTGFLPACPTTVTGSTGPCVVSKVEKQGTVLVTLHIIDGDPRFWTGKPPKPPKPPKK